MDTYNVKKQQSGAGIAGMILGIAAILTSCILIGGVLGFIGIILSAVGASKKDKNSGTAIAGIVLNIIALFITVFVFFSFIGKNSNPENSNDDNIEYSAVSPEKSKDPFSDNIIDVNISDCHIKYLRHEIVENMSGDKCVAVYYEFTNNSDEGKTFDYAVSDKAFQDGIELEISMFHVNDESKNSGAEIKPGVKIVVCSGFVLRNEDSDVELEIGKWIAIKDEPDDKMILSVK